MVSCLSYSQSLTPLVIKIDSTKYYCYDSISIRQVAIYLNNAFTSDSIIESYKVLVGDQDSLQSVCEKEKINLYSQLTITEKQFLLQKQETTLYKKELIIKRKKNKLLSIGIVIESVLIILLCISN